MNTIKNLVVFRPIDPNDTFIVNVISASTKAPSSASDGAKYINTRTKKIYTYRNGWGSGESLSQNNVYHIIGTKTYKRFLNKKFVDRDYVEFPQIGNPIVLFPYTYNAQRMGIAPNISASAQWNDCLENMWSENCFVIFRGERFYLKQNPTTIKTNEIVGYKHEMLFESERAILNDVLFFDVVTPYTKERPISENYKFSFFGDIEALRKRINVSLVNAGISKYVLKNGVTNYPTLKEWNSWGAEEFTMHKTIFDQYNGNYSFYLQSEIFEYNNGEFLIDGYQVIIGTDAYGEKYKSEEKKLSFDKNTIYEAIESIDKVFGLKFYFDGKNIIVGDAQKFFNEEFEYGADKALLSAEKSNSNEKIINRCSGIGSSDNLPYYYPNPTEDGFLDIKAYRTDGIPIRIKPFIIKNKNNINSDSFNKNKLRNRFIYGKKLKFEKIEQTISTDSLGNLIINICYEHMFNTHGFIIFDNNYPFTNAPNMIDVAIDKEFNLEASNALKNHQPAEINGGLVDIFITQNLTKDRVSQGYYYEPFSKDIILGFGNDKHVYHLNYGGFYVYDELRPAILVEYTRKIFNKPNKLIFYLEQPPIGYDELNIKSVTPVMVRHLSGNMDFNYQIPYPRIENKLYFDLGNNLIYKYINGFFELQSDASSYTYPELSEIIKNDFDFNLMYFYDSWYLDNKIVRLRDYGISLLPNDVPQLNDIIGITRIKYLTLQSNLMPSLYRNSDGERRFYNANNYPIFNVEEADTDKESGEEFQADSNTIINPLYHDDSVSDAQGDYNQYDFKNKYSVLKPKEHIEAFDDIKPTIVEMKYQGLRIDIVQEFAYDEYDDDTTWNVSDKNTNTLEFKHPHFYAKLRPLGFNLFDCALEKGDMVIGMTTGNCGSCNFKIKVDSKTNKNPVQIWEENIYEKNQDGTYSIAFNRGDLKRHYNNRVLYKKIDETNYEKINTNFYGNVYPKEEILNNMIGSIKVNNMSHSEGDIVNYGSFQETQQDTTDNYVWVALEKDISSYGVIMPSAKPIYNNGEIDIQLSSYLRPKSYEEMRKEAENSNVNPQIIDDYATKNADKFVITNILLPQEYIYYAEEKLSKAIIKYMAEHNNWNYNFSIKFSRVYLAQNPQILETLNENSKIKVRYNGIEYTLYVSSYSYKMSNLDAIPEITIDLKEHITAISYSNFRRILSGGTIAKKDVGDNIDVVGEVINITDKRYISQNGISHLNGEIIIDNDKVVLSKELLSMLSFKSKIDSLKLSGDKEVDGINIMRAKQSKASDDITVLKSNETHLVSRSNEITKIINQLNSAIIEFNKANEKTVIPINPQWHCLEGICRDLPDIEIEKKPLNE